MSGGYFRIFHIVWIQSNSIPIKTNWLVVSTIFDFPQKNGIWDVILPIDLHMFQDGEIAPPIKTVSMDESRVDE